MTIFKLERFPHVCRTCLQPKAEEQMTILNEHNEKHGAKLIDLLEELTFPIPEELNFFTPSSICMDCLKELDKFLDYRKRLNYVLKFIFGLAQVKKGNIATLKDLFTEDRTITMTLLTELRILDRGELQLEDLLGEFSQYEIGSMTDVKKEYREDELDQNFLEDSLVKVEVDEGGMIVEYLETTVKRKRGRPKLKTTDSPKVKRKPGRPKKIIDDSEEEDKAPNSLKNEEMDRADSTEEDDLDENDMIIERLSNASEHFADQDLTEMLDNSESNFQEDVDSDEEFQLDESLLGRQKKHKRLSPRGQKKGDLQYCSKCKFKTYYPKTFDVHMEKHLKREQFPMLQRCKRCDMEFETKKELDKHKRLEHRDFMCDTCGLSFEQKFALETHRKRHEDVRQFKCEYCPMEYYTRPEMLLHVKQVHLNAFQVKCPDCGLSFKTKSTLNQHIKTHTNQRTHTCSVCGYGFKSYTHLNRHIKSVHQDVRYNCDHCEISYGRKDKLRMHMEKVHNIQTYFVCDICLQSYNSKDKLDEHRAHHDNPKPLQCGICLAAHVTQEEFDQHLCITYKDNYMCCNRDFKYHFYYNKHMFLAHGMKTNVRVKPTEGLLLGQVRAMRKQAERCPKCEQEFPTRNQKKQHMISCRGPNTTPTSLGSNETTSAILVPTTSVADPSVTAVTNTYEIELIECYENKDDIVHKVEVI
ncbi:zinc finger protein 652-like [Toxorhynchites rutilus septentrionalis]|uniref:zinc finger protein 652-like n=1 Tax=Toxorhynchites rutilus septentrionalis TaxID=329112 RepID=UPI0024789179|nr:zinc finger protein 652-like [Toxorhynchites rutilus septentrionalis]XP_055630892.1 zinc finger protein 652-like [Toxorhynchites rutilus septentrionalis]